MKAWAGSRKEQTLTENVATVGDVTIHSLQIELDHPDIVTSFLGADPTIHLGIGPTTLWYAAGPGAVDLMKQSIESLAGEPATGPVKAIELQARMHPWFTLLDQIRAEQPVPTTREEKTKRKEQDARRAVVLESTAEGDDVLTFEMQREGDQITGSLHAVRGFLRFVAKEVARFTKENLDVGG